MTTIDHRDENDGCATHRAQRGAGHVFVVDLASATTSYGFSETQQGPERGLTMSVTEESMHDAV